MAKHVEKQARNQNPMQMTGLDESKIGMTIGTVTHRVGQKGKSVQNMEVRVNDLFSPKELRFLAFQLVTHHRLRLKDIRVETENTTVLSLERVLKRNRF